MRRFLSASLVAGLLAGCFQAFDDYKQLAMPARPPGAAAVKPGPRPVVFPLVAGSRFDYRAHFGLGTDGPFTGEAIVSVLDAWTVAGVESESVRIVSRYFGRERIEPYIFTRNATSLGLYEKAPPDLVTWFMPTSLELGDAWQIETGEGAGTAEVEAVESVTVPAGTFADSRRVRYRNEAAHTDFTLWIAPRVGLVRASIEMRIALLTLRGTVELVHHRIPVDK